MKVKARAMPFDFLKGLAVFHLGRVVQRAWLVCVEAGGGSGAGVAWNRSYLHMAQVNATISNQTRRQAINVQFAEANHAAHPKNPGAQVTSAAVLRL